MPGIIDKGLNALLGVLEVTANTTLDAVSVILTGKTVDRNITLAERNAEVADDISEGIDEAFEGVFETAEEDVLAELEQAGEVTPGNVEEIIDSAEGSAVAQALIVASANLAVEGGALGQLETHEAVTQQVLATLVLDDVLGKRLEAEFAEGIEPAVKARVGKRRRSKFVDFQDAVEFGLRTKETDEGYLTLSGGSDEYADNIGSNNQVSSDNALEEWGIRDDQLPILEQVALNDMEFEELIETPAELGLVVPNDVLEAELDRAGYAEATKEFLLQVNDRIELSARAYQELLVTEDHISDLDQRVEDGTLDADEALRLVPDGIEISDDALLQRWEQKAQLDPSAPSQAEFIDSLVNGYVGLQDTKARLDVAELDTSRYDDVLKVEILDELDGALQQAVALGQLSEARFTDLCQFVGLDQQACDALLEGQSLSDITKARLQKATPPAERSVRTIVGIGESRGQALIAAGIETVTDLAQADVEAVADAADVSPETAQEFINQAQQRIR